MPWLIVIMSTISLCWDGGRGSNLSQTVRYSTTAISSFKSQVKTHLFRVVGNPSVFFVCCKKNYCCLFLWCGLFVSMCCQVIACCRCKIRAWKYVRRITYCRIWVKGSEEPADWTKAFKLELSSLTFLWRASSWTGSSQEWLQGSWQNQRRGCCESQE